jgi:hypothetical protein
VFFRRSHSAAVGTELIPNPVAGDSERGAGKPKKRNGLRKPKSELPPNRIRGWRRFDVRDDLVIPQRALQGLSRMAFPYDGVECDHQKSIPGGRHGIYHSKL